MFCWNWSRFGNRWGLPVYSSSPHRSRAVRLSVSRKSAAVSAPYVFLCLLPFYDTVFLMFLCSLIFRYISSYYSFSSPDITDLYFHPCQVLKFLFIFPDFFASRYVMYVDSWALRRKRLWSSSCVSSRAANTGRPIDSRRKKIGEWAVRRNLHATAVSVFPPSICTFAVSELDRSGFPENWCFT